MIETRPQDSVAWGADPGHPEPSDVGSAAVAARGYNFDRQPARPTPQMT